MAKELVTEDMATWKAKILAIDLDSGNKGGEMSPLMLSRPSS